MSNKIAAILLASSFALAACSNDAPKEQAADTTPTDTKVVTITGAGASFPQPIYAQWTQAYQKETGVQINYQSIGSSGGVKQITANTVDFGASDAPLSEEKLAEDNLIQFPTVVGGVVPVVNIDGINAGELHLTGDALAKIYLGEITNWSDEAIKTLNPDLTLPDANITTVFRSDGSGTSFNFTHYLSQVSEKWQNDVGSANSVKWPTTSTGTAGKGNEGVSALIGKVKNSIGYVEYAYAKQNNISHVALINAAGNLVQPSNETFSAAADTDWSSAPGFNLVLTNQKGDNAWPIASATFILVHQKVEDPEKVKEVFNFFDWAYKNGDDAANALDYVPLPENTKDLIRSSWSTVVDANGNTVYTK